MRAELLLQSGVFDLEHYSACADRTFRSAQDAARHCVRVGMPAGLSPHPLLDLTSVPRPIQVAWRAGRVAVLLQHLKRAAGSDRTIGPLFDPVAAPGTELEKAMHPGGALGHFLESARPDTPLPLSSDHSGSGTPPTLADARGALRDRVREMNEQTRLVHGGPRRELDPDEERSWHAGLRPLPVAPADGSPTVSILLRSGWAASEWTRILPALRRQSLTGWELLVVRTAPAVALRPDDQTDDQTGDQTADQRDARSDDRVHFVPSPGTGAGSELDALLRRSRGAFVTFADDSTSWPPDFLETMVRGLLDPGVDAARAGVRTPRPALLDAGADTLDALVLRESVDLEGLVLTSELASAAGGFDADVPSSAAERDFLIRVASRSPIGVFPVSSRRGPEDRPAAPPPAVAVDPWQLVVLGRNLVDWPAAVRAAPERDTRVVSVVIPTFEDWKMTLRATRAVLSDADQSHVPVEVVVVDNGSAPEVHLRLTSSLLGEARVHCVRLPRNLNFAVGCNVGFSRSHGSVVVFLNNDTIPRPGWLMHLLRPLEQPDVRGVQPLLLYPDDTVQSAGTIFAAEDFLPAHFLVGHPPEDADRLSDKTFPAVTAAALAMRADEFAELGGFDPLFVNGMEDVDLCLRSSRRFGGRFVLETRSRVTHLEGRTPGRGAMIEVNRRHFMERWRGSLPAPSLHQFADLGLTVAHLASDGAVPAAARPVTVRARPQVHEGRPRLRWGLKLPATAGPLGDAWGDTLFAESLKGALTRLGQDVVTYRRGSHASATSHLDDVVLGLRGLERVSPLPGKINLLWVISHPELVSLDEFEGFDAVFTASPTWSRQVGAAAGRTVRCLLQAVDGEASAPSYEREPNEEHQLVFVGATHPGRDRRAVLDVLRAGVPIAIHGHGWDATQGAAHVVSKHLPSQQVADTYHRHGLVLADHWPDMAANGFIANRVFDAVGAGARVISDDVVGVEDLFGGAVRVYRSIEDLRHLCSPAGRERFASDEELSRIAGWCGASTRSTSEPRLCCRPLWRPWPPPAPRARTGARTPRDPAVAPPRRPAYGLNDRNAANGVRCTAPWSRDRAAGAHRATGRRPRSRGWSARCSPWRRRSRWW